MFHVKHPSESAGPGSGLVGAEVRRRVAQALEAIRWLPASPGFLPRIEIFANLLNVWGARHNLTAQPENPSELAFHIIDSLMVIPVLENCGSPGLFDRGKEVLDLGSGAGLPGLVLAAATAACFTLAESRRKRISFLRVAIAEMGLANATITSMFLRPEDLAPRFDVMTGRAFAKQGVFRETALAGLRSGGVALLYAGSGAEGHGPDRGGIDKELSYQLERGGRTVSRRLLIWRKA